MQVVTIDGPAGAGKSTVARRVAERLGWSFLDTGAMYRAVALAGIRRGLDLHDANAFGALAASLRVEQTPGRVRLDGEDVTEAIRRPDVTEATRFVASHPGVRSVLVGWQREFASHHDTVTEGRDQGTIVFPDALCKVFLTADPAERARRRHAELEQKGQTFPLEVVQDDLRRRDATDETRAAAPLRPATDAVILDTTGLSLEEVVGHVLDHIRQAQISSLTSSSTP